MFKDFASPDDAQNAVDILNRYLQDPARATHVRSLLKKSGVWGMLDLPVEPEKIDGPPPAFPEASTITAIQTAIFDNWPTGKPVKGHPNRYGCAIEAWTKPASQINIHKVGNHQHKSQMALMNKRNLKEFIRTLRRPRKTPIDLEYLDLLEGLANSGRLDEPGTFVGMVNTTIGRKPSPYERGVYHHAYQFVFITLNFGKVEQAQLFLGPDEIDLGKFDENDAAGKPHGRGVILQSRLDLCGLTETTWATTARIRVGGSLR